MNYEYDLRNCSTTQTVSSLRLTWNFLVHGDAIRAARSGPRTDRGLIEQLLAVHAVIAFHSVVDFWYKKGR